MRTGRFYGIGATVLVLALGAVASAAEAPAAGEGAAPLPEKVVFNDHIRPILTNKCFKCHGPDAKNRQTDLRFDSQEAAFQDLGGYRAIVPGKPAESELIKRVTAEDPSERMPPQEEGGKLSDRKIALLKKWIEQGADWTKQWALIDPERPTPPKVDNEEWVRNPIDRFVLDKLERKGLSPSEVADKRSLIRRLSLDLTGLPPTPEQVRRFVNDGSPDAYERLVDRLLNSPRYGEHMARAWLDAARYGDTHGMHFDNKRSIWPYRDWVIEAFNKNKPFDQFTIEQLAGDLLPDPNREQLVATGFNRCNITTNEGGTIKEEARVQYMIDRTTTASTVFLGLTTSCAQCHDHKYDPIKQKEFYELTAFFNSIADKPLDGNKPLPKPKLMLPTDKQQKQIDAYDQRIAEVRKQIEEKVAARDYKPPKDAKGESDSAGRHRFVWIDDQAPKDARQGRLPAGGAKKWSFVSGPDHPVKSGKLSVRVAAENPSRWQYFLKGAERGLRIGKGDVLFAWVYLDPDQPPQEIMMEFNDGGGGGDQWDHRATWGPKKISYGELGTPSHQKIGPLPETGKWVRVEAPAAKLGFKPGDRIKGLALTQYGGTMYWDRIGIETSVRQPSQPFRMLAAWAEANRDQKPRQSGLPADIQKILNTEASKRDKAQKAKLEDYFVEHVWADTRDVFEPLHQKIAAIESKKQKLREKMVGTMITRNLPERRQAHVLVRGQYNNKGEEVEPRVPDALHDWEDKWPRNRLGFAKWLLDEDNPLTTRVIVNRYWQEYFGEGLVRTPENFGALGDKPTHPALLDWLATEFRRSGWDVKHMQRLIVTSATYRQSSKFRKELRERDPNNKLLARGPRFRLDAETIRDQALAASGLLVGKIGGKPVFPYQPDGLWKAIAYESSNTRVYERDHGSKLYRRSVYTFWKRTSPPPPMTAFNAPSREDCTVSRERTNTPLQALVLLNEKGFFEAARNMAERLMAEGGQSPKERIDYAFRLVLARSPDQEEMSIALEQYRKQLAKYERDPSAAKRLIDVGESKTDPSLEPAKLAAWTMVANMLLNLDETITKS